MKKLVIEIIGVSKSFSIPHERMDTLKEHFLHLFHSRTYETFNALEGVSLAVPAGEFLGVVGLNGSGKSTLLKIIARVLFPQTGQVVVQGRVSPFLELGVGFQPDLSGRENVYLYGALLGLSRQQIREVYDRIVSFAELERFMDQKLKNYSSGMQVRLAFAIIAQADADIYLIDEALAVGDVGFQNKCLDFFKDLKRRGKTIVFVSHDLGAMEKFADRVVIMDHGKIRAVGDTEPMLDVYRNSFLAPTSSYSSGNGIQITEVTISNAQGVEGVSFRTGESITVRFSYLADRPIHHPIFQVQICDEVGTLCHGENTERHSIDTGEIVGGGVITVRFPVLNLLKGSYRVLVRVWPENFHGQCYHEYNPAPHFKVISEESMGGGICAMPGIWHIDHHDG